MRCYLPVITYLLLFTTNSHAAELLMKSGLWEITTTSRLLHLASQLPPDQLESINAFAKEYGLEIPEIQNGAAKSNSCITPEMAKQKTLPSTFENQAGCTIKHAKRTGNDYRMEYICKSTELDGSGIVEGTLSTNTQFNGRTTFNGLVQGNPFNEQANITGQWISANCALASPQK
jgi:hypothetical protein